MKAIKQIGLVIFLLGLSIFTGSLFSGSFSLTSAELEEYLQEKGYKSERIKDELSNAVVTDEALNIFEFSSRARTAFANSNQYYDELIAKYDAEKIGT